MLRLGKYSFTVLTWFWHFFLRKIALEQRSSLFRHILRAIFLSVLWCVVVVVRISALWLWLTFWLFWLSHLRIFIEKLLDGRLACFRCHYTDRYGVLMLFHYSVSFLWKSTPRSLNSINFASFLTFLLIFDRGFWVRCDSFIFHILKRLLVHSLFDGARGSICVIFRNG